MKVEYVTPTKYLDDDCSGQLLPVVYVFRGSLDEQNIGILRSRSDFLARCAGSHAMGHAQEVLHVIVTGSTCAVISTAWLERNHRLMICGTGQWGLAQMGTLDIVLKLGETP